MKKSSSKTKIQKAGHKKQLQKIAKGQLTQQQMELAAVLAAEFAKHGASLTVVGGAAVQFYTQSGYVTKDVDAVLIGDTTEIIETVMTSLGFKRASTYRHFEHPLFGFVIEFPPEPIAVGSRGLYQFAEVKTNYGPVRILRIEDLIMDRITAGIEWRSEKYLAQAKLLWLSNKDDIDLKYLRNFAKEEGYEAVLRKVMKP